MSLQTKGNQYAAQSGGVKKVGLSKTCPKAAMFFQLSNLSKNTERHELFCSQIIRYLD